MYTALATTSRQQLSKKHAAGWVIVNIEVDSLRMLKLGAMHISLNV